MLGTYQNAKRSAPPARPDPAALRAGEDRAAFAVVEKTIERLELLIDQETAALQSRTAVDLKDFNDRKSLGLLELTRAMRPIEGAPPDPALHGRLSRLREKLEINRAALRMHLEAVREISTIVADAMRNAESDGTYTPSIRGGRAR
jgi:hypothetical protein